MADEREQISGKLREDRRSSSTVDQSLMNRSVSDTDEEMIEEDEEENSPQPGEEYANLREQQTQARNEKANDMIGKAAGKVASAYVGGGVQGKIVGKVAEDLVKKQAKKRIKIWLIGAAVGCLPGCLIIAGLLAIASIMLFILDNPVKAFGMIFDSAWEIFKSIF